MKRLFYGCALAIVASAVFVLMGSTPAAASQNQNATQVTYSADTLSSMTMVSAQQPFGLVAPTALVTKAPILETITAKAEMTKEGSQLALQTLTGLQVATALVTTAPTLLVAKAATKSTTAQPAVVMLC
jgi:hypothetical protein